MLIKLLKPTWVHHDDKPIFSVDVHQNCLKFATGGQGNDSGRIAIWNLLPVLSEEAELNESIPKKLCQMDNHLACVNVVRWSENGQMLASGSDDKLVMIWRKAKGSSGIFGSGGIQNNAETWKCIATLRGHSGDVLDLAWSPQDRWLASCSVDNTIIVWDAQALPTMIAMLKGHTGLVKGVTWDPVGKFLASQSDDRSVKIWKTSDWSCGSTITEPFEECGGTTHVLRLSWSPDGQYLVSAHAMNGGGPTAQIIEREGWRCDKDFVGHRKAVTCVRFHNAILKRQAPKSNKPQQYCCLAVGSRDRSLSVWMTALQRPLIVIHDLFNDSILDMSWGSEKCILLACSGDGTVACLQFSESELGTPLSEEEKNQLYQRVYGKSLSLENGSNTTQDLLIENPELLNTSQEKPKAPFLPLSVQTSSATSNASSNHHQQVFNTSINGFSCHDSSMKAPTSPAITKQVETRTADGRRRITPVFIPPKDDESAEKVVNRLPSTLAPVAGSAMDSSVDLQIISSVRDMPKPVITEAEQTRLDARLIKSTAAAGTKTGGALIQPNQTERSIIGTFPSTSIAMPISSYHHRTTSAAQTPAAAAAAANQYQASTTGPKITITAATKCEFQKTALNHRIHVHNGLMQSGQPPSALIAKVTAYSFVLGPGHKLWEMFVGSPIVNLNFCTKYAMLCSLDGTLRLLHMSNGQAVLPVMSLTSATIQCAFCPQGKLVGCITDCGILRIWNIADKRIELATSCTEIFGKFGAVIQFHITENGVPLVLFANGNSYTYSMQLQSWLVVSTKDPILRHGLQATVPKETQKDFQRYPLTSVQAAAQGFAGNSAGSSALNLNGNEWQKAAKITFIENQLKLCEAINSAEELKHWYAMLAYQLALSGSEQNLRQLLDDLLGAPAEWRREKTKQKQKHQHNILNIDKHALLESVLNVLKSHVKWQRLYMEYKELFENAKTHSKTS